MLHETKQLFSKTFDMQDLCEASFVLGIENHRDRLCHLFRLSQKAYIEHALKRFNMQGCKFGEVLITEGMYLIRISVLLMR